ncbi:MAG: TonB-dependent receptor [Gammaproteobacteria bacterium]|nr:TonB-dependent receptor [Gammaproteobacteria bacterium]
MAFDGNLRYSAAAYYQQYSDYLPRASNVNALVATGAGRVPQVVQGMVFNADAAVVGVEVGWTALLGERFQFGGGLSYSRPFDDDELGPCNRPFTPAEIADPTVEIATCDIGGEDVSSQPDWSATLNASTLPRPPANSSYDRCSATRREGEGTSWSPPKLDDYRAPGEPLCPASHSGSSAWERNRVAPEPLRRGHHGVFSNPYCDTGRGTNFTRAVTVPPRCQGRDRELQLPEVAGYTAPPAPRWALLAAAPGQSARGVNSPR